MCVTIVVAAVVVVVVMVVMDGIVSPCCVSFDHHVSSRITVRCNSMCLHLFLYSLAFFLRWRVSRRDML